MRADATQVVERDVALPGGLTLRCREAGAGPRRVVLLHGFPEAAFVWDATMRALAGQASCLAPNLRGYAGSSAPLEEAAYRPQALIDELASLIEALGAPLDLLVAHDWGGALAWGLAARRPELLRRLLVVNAPHPAAFLRELRDNPAQQAASAYMNFLARDDAEALLKENDFGRLFDLLERSGAAGWLDAAMRARYRRVWQHGLAGPLAYYRASPLRPGEALRGMQLPDALVEVHVPTWVLWGERDQALLPGLLEGLGRWVPRLEVERVADASHWIVHEQPVRVVAAVRRALATPV
ncbi:MAG: alpha/beta hydrolase [Rubrivivax sp.]|nr:alpha/beta hydrolase [Rubrivivax sp.]